MLSPPCTPKTASKLFKRALPSFSGYASAMQSRHMPCRCTRGKFPAYTFSLLQHLSWVLGLGLPLTSQLASIGVRPKIWELAFLRSPICQSTLFFFGNLFGHVNLHFTFSLVSFKNDLLWSVFPVVKCYMSVIVSKYNILYYLFFYSWHSFHSHSFLNFLLITTKVTLWASRLRINCITALKY